METLSVALGSRAYPIHIGTASLDAAELYRPHLGGGAVLARENRALLSERGTVVYLRATPEHLYERVRQDRNRPLLAGDDPLGRLRELYRERDPLYREVADVVIDTGRQSVQVLARALLEQLGTLWKRSA